MSRTNQASRQAGDAIRTFICIEVPPPIRARIEELQRALRRSDVPISWVKSSNIHLTIKFLGDLAALKIPHVRQAVERACLSISPFDITVVGTGCFPSA